MLLLNICKWLFSKNIHLINLFSIHSKSYCKHKGKYYAGKKIFFFSKKILPNLSFSLFQYSLNTNTFPLFILIEKEFPAASFNVPCHHEEKTLSSKG